MEVFSGFFHRLQGPWHGCPCLLMLAFGGKTFSQLFWNGSHNMTIGSDLTFLQPYHLKIQVAIHWWPFLLVYFVLLSSFFCHSHVFLSYQLFLCCLFCHFFANFLTWKKHDKEWWCFRKMQKWQKHMQMLFFRKMQNSLQQKWQCFRKMQKWEMRTKRWQILDTWWFSLFGSRARSPNHSAPTVTCQDARGSCKTYFSDRSWDCSWLSKAVGKLPNDEFAIGDID